SSDFARDFYAAGTGEGLIGDVARDPPPSSAPATSSSASSRRESSNSSSAQNDRTPTTQPVAGRPLLKDGKLLVYPKGFQCDKCHNVGYKHADPLHPCKKCWAKYAKPFTGPLAFSYTRSEPGLSPESSNFQKPLPRMNPPAPPPPQPFQQQSFGTPPAQFPPGGYHQGGFYGPPNPMAPFQTMSPPPPGTVVYPAGDPRIGGRLCWRCNGKGNVSFLFDRMNCEVCGGVGRTFF
ncbi:hypothetical protein CVT24_011042, partial [Panaeolus cyanescens]